MSNSTSPTALTAPTTPVELLEQFSRFAAVGDVDGLVSLYERDAVFQPQPGLVCRGRDEIGAALAELAALRPRIVFDDTPDVVEVGTVALVSSRWSMRGTAPDGSEVTDGGLSADVLRRQPEGTWLVVIDQPRGEAPA